MSGKILILAKLTFLQGLWTVPAITQHYSLRCDLFVLICNDAFEKEVEKEISKINKEIANLKWSLKNEVLTQEKRAQKIQKIKDLKKTCTE